MRSVVRLLVLIVVLCLTCGQALAAPIEISSPLDYQVFQRQSRLRGTVQLAGKVPAATVVEFRITGDPLEGKLPDGWQPLAVDRKTGTFRLAVAVPAGGWYRIDLRAVANGATVAEAAIDHVGVGEVFVVAGQSNSANYGEQRQRPTTDRVVSFDGSRWAIANDPQHGADGEGGSFIPAFGDALVKLYRVPIGLACVGVGGTSVREWLPKGDPVAAVPTTGANVVATGPNSWVSSGALFERLSGRIGQFGPRGFRALLWHQGESDANQPPGHNISADQYRRYLARLIQAARDGAGWRIPWFVAQASYHTPSEPGSSALRAAQKSLWTDGTALEGPNTDNLVGEMREANGLGVHFSARGLRRHGELWAKHVAAWLDRQLHGYP
jgi:hypothetical protein